MLVNGLRAQLYLVRASVLRGFVFSFSSSPFFLACSSSFPSSSSFSPASSTSSSFSMSSSSSSFHRFLRHFYLFRLFLLFDFFVFSVYFVFFVFFLFSVSFVFAVYFVFPIFFLFSSVSSVLYFSSFLSCFSSLLTFFFFIVCIVFPVFSVFPVFFSSLLYAQSAFLLFANILSIFFCIKLCFLDLPPNENIYPNPPNSLHHLLISFPPGISNKNKINGDNDYVKNLCICDYWRIYRRVCVCLCTLSATAWHAWYYFHIICHLDFCIVVLYYVVLCHDG